MDEDELTFEYIETKAELDYKKNISFIFFYYSSTFRCNGCLE